MSPDREQSLTHPRDSSVLLDVLTRTRLPQFGTRFGTRFSPTHAGAQHCRCCNVPPRSPFVKRSVSARGVGTALTRVPSATLRTSSPPHVEARSQGHPSKRTPGTNLPSQELPL